MNRALATASFFGCVLGAAVCQAKITRLRIALVNFLTLLFLSRRIAADQDINYLARQEK